MFKIVIFAHNENNFLIAKNEIIKINFFEKNIIWCDSRKYSREDVVNENLNTWLLFLDSDCAVLPSSLVAVEKIITSAKNNMNCAYVGSYQNPENASYLQIAHNFIANHWVKNSFNNNVKFIIGGAFLINSSIKIQLNKIFWGSEDKLMSYKLHKANFNISYSPEIVVLHNTSKSLPHYLKRAYIHGYHDAKYIEPSNKVSYFYWIRSIGFANLFLLPAIFLHFCMQKVGRYTHRVRHLHKK